jgi:predicted membrane channel-forming protein YqfA (hemolysin III family)
MQWDYLGIGVAIGGSMIPGAYFGLACFTFWRWTNVTILTLLFAAMIAFLTLPPAWFGHLPSSPRGMSLHCHR